MPSEAWLADSGGGWARAGLRGGKTRKLGRAPRVAPATSTAARIAHSRHALEDGDVAAAPLVLARVLPDEEGAVLHVQELRARWGAWHEIVSVA